MDFRANLLGVSSIHHHRLLFLPVVVAAAGVKVAHTTVPQHQVVRVFGGIEGLDVVYRFRLERGPLSLRTPIPIPLHTLDRLHHRMLPI